MVKIVLSLLLLLNISFARDILFMKIEHIIGHNSYKVNKNLIKELFKDRNEFLGEDGTISIEKILETLRKNSIGKKIYNEPTKIEIEFISSKKPIFTTKSAFDSLSDIGYYYAITKKAGIYGDYYRYGVIVNTNQSLNMLALYRKLKDRNIKVLDVIHDDRKNTWTLYIDMSHPTISGATELAVSDEELRLRKTMSILWFVPKEKGVFHIKSNRPNRWHPYIVEYDSNLKIIKLIKITKVIYDFKTLIDENVRFIKVSDLYSLSNIKSGFTIKYEGK